MKRSTFDSLLADRLQSECGVAAPTSFMGELGDLIRTLPPPAPPVPRSFVSRHRRGLVVAAAALLGVVFFAGSDRRPHNPAGLAVAMQSMNEQVVALPETATSFTHAAYEREWECIKEDAESLASPFPVSAFGLMRP